jgi:group II intron reverse transcriptase/maturase
VLDRFIQQAILQVLQPRFDPTFSEHSYGFRPGRRAHDAVLAAQRFVEQGKPWVVDVDLSKFFDRVNHDVLMGRLAKRIEDKTLLRLIRRYLEAGVMVNGVVIERYEGTPQGGPLSPLLTNVLLDDVDQELERRGLSFCRYADDANVYVASKRAGERVMASLRKLYAKLRLTINEDKSAVAPVEERQFLGFTFVRTRGGKVKRRIADKALRAMKDRVREVTGRNSGRSLSSIARDLRRFLVGWIGYFRITEVRSPLHELDSWIRRRLRVVQLEQWRCGRTVFRHLRARGVERPIAALIASRSRRLLVGQPPAVRLRGAARQALRRHGGPSLGRLTSTFRTAVYGPVRTVVWEGSGVSLHAAPYPDPAPSVSCSIAIHVIKWISSASIGGNGSGA